MSQNAFMARCKALLIGAMAGLLLVGCGAGDTKVVVTPGGSMTVKEDAGGKTSEFKGKDENGKDISLKVSEGKDGVVNWESSDGTKITAGLKVNEAELGAPVYPGSTPTSKDGGVKTTNGDLVTVIAAYTTPDAVSKVGEFYTGKIKDAEKNSMSTGGFEMVTFTRSDPDDKLNVMVTKDESTGQTTISITRTFKQK